MDRLQEIWGVVRDNSRQFCKDAFVGLRKVLPLTPDRKHVNLRLFYLYFLLLVASIVVLLVYTFIACQPFHGFEFEAGRIGRVEYHVVDTTHRVELDEEPTILVVTPLREAMLKINQYEDHVRSFSYPHNRISLGFLIGDSTDGTYEYIRDTLGPRFVSLYGFKRVEIVQYNVDNPMNVKIRHRLEMEKKRRTSLSKTRNTLLRTLLTDEDYVMWLDHDLDYFPSTVIEDLIDTKTDCVIPVSLESPGGRTYDRNNWVETPASLEHIKSLPEDFILYEGHEGDDPRFNTQRAYLRDLSQDYRNYREVIRLDGVGSTILLINGHLHRHGLVFPEFPFDHQIESEGLSRMAYAMGSSCWGMPNYITIHHQPDWPNIYREG